MISDATLITLTEDETMILVGVFARAMDTQNPNMVIQRIKWCTPTGAAKKLQLAKDSVLPEYLPILESLIAKILSRAAG